MCAFDKIIGYETIKQELMQICDMIHNQDVYQALGAKLPNGLLLHGKPGLGKTLMARCFIEESGLSAFTVRRNKSSRDFINGITEIFQQAKVQAPSIVFLDDLDKFANEDDEHLDAEEYVAVQAGIDEVRGANVFVLATANDMDKLPDSLTRPGRFDRKIAVSRPSEQDIPAIIQHYLKNKRVSPELNMEDIAMMISYTSCAELETILNEAAIFAAYARKTCIDMDDLVQAVLREHYNSPDDYMRLTEEELQKIAIHEAGHVVVSEVLHPGSVGLASVRDSCTRDTAGFVRRCKGFTRRAHHILIALAGKAAVELHYSETCASGCQFDLDKAIHEIRWAISESGTCGVGMLSLSRRRNRDESENFSARNEAVVHAELERYMFKTREILIKNKDFLREVTAALMAKNTILYSDIRDIRNRVEITEVSV